VTTRENEPTPPSRVHRVLMALGVAGGIVVIAAAVLIVVFGWIALQRGADYLHPGNTQPAEPALTVSSTARTGASP